MGWLNKSLTFPMAGVVRRSSYREQSRPYSAPWAWNVRGTGSVELRDRGGSRPGMVSVFEDALDDPGSGAVSGAVNILGFSALDGEQKRFLIAYITNVGVLRIGDPATGEIFDLESASLTTDDSVQIITDNGDDIVYASTTDATAMVERGGKLLLAGSSLQEMDPWTGAVETIAPSMGSVPAGCPLICLYRDRVILAGADQMWYASRQSDYTDWNFGADMNDEGRAVAGQVAPAGRIGYKITALIPVDDSRLIIATHYDIWMLTGDPATGNFQQIASDVGIISNSAWSINPDGTIVFLGMTGVNVINGTKVERWSENMTPAKLRNVRVNHNIVSMQWDNEGRGFHLFVTPKDVEQGGIHWWLDWDSRSMWPVKFLNLGHNPVATCEFRRQEVVASAGVLGRDGYLRIFDPDEDRDDGYTIVSQVIIGPLRLPPDDMTDAILQQVSGSMSSESANFVVNWRSVSANSAEKAAKAAVTALDTLQEGLLVSAYPTGAWSNGRNRVRYPRQRGPWVAICLYSEDQWAYESIAIRGLTAGRLRDGN